MANDDVTATTAAAGIEQTPPSMEDDCDNEAIAEEEAAVWREEELQVDNRRLDAE